MPCRTLEWPFSSSPNSWVAIETLTERETAFIGKFSKRSRDEMAGPSNQYTKKKKNDDLTKDKCD